MTFTEINDMIESIGFPSVYYQWETNGNIPPLPYVIFYYPATDNFSADNIVYQQIIQLNVELYTKRKDFASEMLVETVLNENGLFWEKQESFIESEDMYEVLYILEIAITQE